MNKIFIVFIIMTGLLFGQDTETDKGTDTYIGEIMLFAGTFTPDGYLPCDGSLLQIQNYSALYSLLGTAYGGDGITTFAVPDLRGRVPVGSGQGSGLSNRPLGQRGGQESVVLTQSQIPEHSHTLSGEINGQLKCYNGTGEDDSPAGNSLANSTMNVYSSSAPDTEMHTGSVTVTGSVDDAGAGFSHNNMQPYIALHFCIAYEGIYPSHPKEKK